MCSEPDMALLRPAHSVVSGGEVDDTGDRRCENRGGLADHRLPATYHGVR